MGVSFKNWILKSSWERMSIDTLNFSIALRRCNSHTTIVCNSTVQSTFPELCNHHNQFQKFSSSPKRNPCPLAVTFPLHPHPRQFSSKLPPRPRQPPIYFLFLICLFWTFHINKIIQHMVYYDCLLSDCIIFSKFIHFYSYVSVLSFLWLNSIPCMAVTG